MVLNLDIKTDLIIGVMGRDRGRKELGFESKRDVEEFGIEKFVMCKERVDKYSKIQTEQSKRLGYWMDWDNSYYTMSDENNYNRSFPKTGQR